MLRVQTPADLGVLVSFTFERQARSDSIEDFRQRLLDAQEVERCVELEGAFDFMIEAHLENLAAFHDFVAQKIDPHRRLISHFEVGFVARSFTKEQTPGNEFWMTDRHGSRRIELDRADCFTAEGDYVRVRIQGDSLLIHATLQSIRERLPDPEFLQIHRSTIVRLDSVVRLVRQGHRWLVELRDGSQHLVAKGRNMEISRMMEQRSQRGPSRSSSALPFDGPVGPNGRKSKATALP